MCTLKIPAVLLCVSALVVGCGDQTVPTASSGIVGINLSQSGNDGPSASGQGTLLLQGAYQTFAFHARQHKDGSVTGSFEGTWWWLGKTRFHGTLDCLRIEGNEAIMSGVVTKWNLQRDVSFPFWARVIDNGEGSGNPTDQMTDVGASSVDCNSDMTRQLYTIERGDIQVRP